MQTTKKPFGSQVATVLGATLLALGGSFGTGAEVEAKNTGTAEYEVTFVPSWNGATHPLDYPYTHGRQGLLTPIIGATHGKDYAVFREGQRPTPGRRPD